MIPMSDARGIIAAATLAIAVVAAACAAPPATPTTERTAMDDGLPSASRPPPPSVPAIEHKGVRYLQDIDGPAQARDQPCGYLLAYDVAAGKLLWQLKVYEVAIDPKLEHDVQEVYFKSMKLQPGGEQLLIENEVGRRYLVDLARRSVKPAP